MKPFPPENAVPASGKPHLVWIDCARWIAMFLVVVCHACDPFNCSPDALTNPEFLRWGAIWGSLLRPSVPLFVMITGALLLPVRETTLGAFYKKRIPRVLFPFLIWSALYALFPWFASLATATPEDAKALTTAFFPYSGFMNGGNGPETTLSSALATLATTPFSFNYFSVHLWYVYMLIGLYLYLPIFSAWVEKVSLKTKAAFLGIWGATLLLPYADVFLTPHLPFGNGYLLGTCSWNAFGTLYAFAGFNGYLILGHYLKNAALQWSTLKTCTICLVLFALGYAVTFSGFSSAAANPASTEEDMELFFTFCSPNVAIMTIAVFLLLRQVTVRRAWLVRALENMTRCGFGIYIIHYFVVGPFFLLIGPSSLPIPLQVPVMAVCIFATSWAITALLRKIFGRKAIYIVG